MMKFDKENEKLSEEQDKMEIDDEALPKRPKRQRLIIENDDDYWESFIELIPLSIYWILWLNINIDENRYS